MPPRSQRALELLSDDLHRFQLMVRDLGGVVAKTGSGEYGAATLNLAAAGAGLMAGLPERQQVWMSGSGS